MIQGMSYECISHRSQADYTGHVDDVPFAENEMRNGQHRQVKRRSNIRSHYSVVLFQRRLFNGAKFLNTSIVHLQGGQPVVLLVKLRE